MIILIILIILIITTIIIMIAIIIIVINIINFIFFLLAIVNIINFFCLLQSKPRVLGLTCPCNGLTDYVLHFWLGSVLTIKSKYLSLLD